MSEYRGYSYAIVDKLAHDVQTTSSIQSGICCQNMLVPGSLQERNNCTRISVNINFLFLEYRSFRVWNIGNHKVHKVLFNPLESDL